MVVVSAADNRFALPLGVMLSTVLRNAPIDAVVHLYVLSDGIAPANRERIDRVVAMHGAGRTVTLTWIDARKHSDTFAALKTTEFFSEAAYLRVLIPDLVSDRYDRAIYLDADLVVERSLAPLWTHPFHGAPLLAVRDYSIQTVGHPKGLARYRDLDLSRSQPYFNSGVLVLNLPAWRQSNTSDRVLEYAHRNRSVVSHADQDGLNAILARDWQPLDPRWNRQTGIDSLDRWPESDFRASVLAIREEVENDPYIDHFTGGDKPWHILSNHPSRDKFLRYLRESGWFTPREFRMWQAVRRLRLPEQYLRRYTRPLRHRLREALRS